MTIPFKYYIPTIARLIKHACLLITKHRVKMEAVVAENAPSYSASFSAALTATQSACDVFLAVWHALDPNA